MFFVRVRLESNFLRCFNFVLVVVGRCLIWPSYICSDATCERVWVCGQCGAWGARGLRKNENWPPVHRVLAPASHESSARITFHMWTATCDVSAVNAGKPIRKLLFMLFVVGSQLLWATYHSPIMQHPFRWHCFTPQLLAICGNSWPAEELISTAGEISTTTNAMYLVAQSYSINVSQWMARANKTPRYSWSFVRCRRSLKFRLSE